MTLFLPDDGAFAEAVRAPAPTRHDRISILFHWATLLLIAAMFWSAWARESADDAAAAARFLTIHRSIGVTIWVVTLLRIPWRILFAAAPALPSTIPAAHHVAARANQIALYALLILQPLTGLLQTIWRGAAVRIVRRDHSRDRPARQGSVAPVPRRPRNLRNDPPHPDWAARTRGPVPRRGPTRRGDGHDAADRPRAAGRDGKRRMTPFKRHRMRPPTRMLS